MPKVSIVIPIYNVKDHMSASVKSAMNQTEHDIEILLVDDGSTDGSQWLCDQYAEADSRIIVVHKENGGLSSARNAGIAVACAPYVLLLDGDDFLHERAVERLLEVSLLYPSDIIQFHYTEVPEVLQLPDLKEVRVNAQAKTAEEAFQNLYRWGGVYASACTKLFRKALLENFPFETIRHEDEMWCTRAFPNNLTVTYIPDVLYGYVMRPGSIIHSGFHRGRMDVLKVKEERMKTLSDLKLTEIELLEWSHLFTTLFMLYVEAKQVEDKESTDQIILYLKYQIRQHRNGVSGRMKIFYCIARVSAKLSLDFYLFCRKIRHR